MVSISNKQFLRFKFYIEQGALSSFSSQKVISEIDGLFTITWNGEQVFHENGILLAELALCLKRWLEYDEDLSSRPFAYQSMDFEEMPILSFKPKPDGSCVLDTVWDETGLPVKVPLLHVISASKEFVRSFETKVCALSFNK